MANPRGRPSNAAKAERAAAQAAADARNVAGAVAQAEAAAKETTEVADFQPAPKDELPQKNEIVRLPPKNEPRRKAMEELLQRDLQTKSKDMPSLESEMGDTKPPEEPQAPEPTPPTPEQMLQGGKFTKTVKVKIDGQEQDVSEEEVEAYGGIRNYQIQKASENRLNEAREILAEAQRLRSDNQPKTPSVDEVYKENIEKLRWGTPEEASQALSAIFQAREKATPQMDQNQLVQAATDQMRYQQAVKDFDGWFPDLASNQMALRLVAAEAQARMSNKGHPGDWNQFFRTIGNEVTAFLGKRQNQPAPTQLTPPPNQPASAKEQRKASAPQVSIPSGSARAEQKEEEPVLTPGEQRARTLNQMRKGRGLPVH